MSKANRKNLSGVLLFDKGVGDSSNIALQKVKRLFFAKKTGHTGTLDPLASGLLPLMFGEATKFAADLIEADKEYLATIRLGFKSTTGDSEGEIQPVEGKDPQQLTLADLEQAAAELTGLVGQVPPMYSALKKDGKPLYEYARQGIEIERKVREIEIFAFEVLECIHQPDGVFVRIKVRCSKGTYIRTLGEDFAAKLGTCGYLTALRRTAVGRLKVEDGLTLGQLESMVEQGRQPEEFLAPVDSLLTSLPEIRLEEELAVRFRHGQRIVLPAEGRQAGRHRVYVEGDASRPAFTGTGILETDGIGALLRPDRLTQEIV